MLYKEMKRSPEHRGRAVAVGGTGRYWILADLLCTYSASRRGVFYDLEQVVAASAVAGVAATSRETHRAERGFRKKRQDRLSLTVARG